MTSTSCCCCVLQAPQHRTAQRADNQSSMCCTCNLDPLTRIPSRKNVTEESELESHESPLAALLLGKVLFKNGKSFQNKE